jgi:hypothetical protein
LLTSSVGLKNDPVAVFTARLTAGATNSPRLSSSVGQPISERACSAAADVASYDVGLVPSTPVTMFVFSCANCARSVSIACRMYATAGLR